MNAQKLVLAGSWSVLALLSASPAAAQLLDPSAPSFTQSFVGNGSTALFAQARDGFLSRTVTGASTTSFSGFSSSVGVLVGVQFDLSVNNTNLGLQTWAQENSQLNASLISEWTILAGSTALTSAPTTLIQYTQPGDTIGYSLQTTWSKPTLSLTSTAPSQLDGFVGSNQIQSTLNTSLEVDRVGIIDPKKAKGDVQAYLTAPPGGTGVSQAGTLSGTVQYQYLEHGDASIFLQDAVNNNYLNETQRSTRIAIIAGGSAGTSTGIESDGQWSCSGDCSRFDLRLNSFSALAAGGQLDFGSVTALSDPNTGKIGNFEATYTFTFNDQAGIGANASRRLGTQVSFIVESGVTAVPEPHDTAMWLAGLGAVGWLSRRRGARGARRGQVLCA